MSADTNNNDNNAVDLRNPDLYINYELSLIEFNRRVLAQAVDESVPLLERLRYVCISSTNLDEFFEVRVAGLKQVQVAQGTQTGPDGMAANDVLREVAVRTQELVAEQYRILNEVLFHELKKENIAFLRRREWNEEQRAWLSDYFENQLLPVLTPMGLDPAHPFPRILNKSLNFIISLSGKDAFGRNISYAVVQAPRSLPRIIALPKAITGDQTQFVFLSSIIHEFLDTLFPGMRVKGCYQFRVTRNSDLFVDEEAVEDLLHALEGELHSRNFGDSIRIEVDERCPDDTTHFLLSQFQVDEAFVFKVNGPVNLSRLMELPDHIERNDLKFPPFTPSSLPATQSSDMFEAISKKDILLHHPFESFKPVIDFLKQASTDPQVLSIKQTLYRTGADSAIVDMLVGAARLGKEVTVVIELRARFDEQENIVLANRLQEAGAHVVYGVVGYKTHAKMIHIVRRENNLLRHYVHLGTGNYHSRTARLYTDYGFFTADQHIAQDVHKVFLQLTGMGKVSKLKCLLQAPFTLFEGMIEKIEREITNAEAGKDARIIAKMNALIEPEVIRTLYRASTAGVKIDLIVRGMCSLRPGVPGVSENIQVRGVIGRFLEHTRVYYFQNDEDPEIYCASADWMDRNLHRRVEVCFPINNKKLKAQVVKDLNIYLADNSQTWQLQTDGTYVRNQPTDEEQAFSAQLNLLETLSD